MEDRIIGCVVVTHLRGMMHQPIMITCLVRATIACRQATETGMKLPCYCNKGFNDYLREVCNPIDSVANADDISTGQTLKVNNAGQANQGCEQHRGTTTTMMTTTAGAIAAPIP